MHTHGWYNSLARAGDALTFLACVRPLAGVSERVPIKLILLRRAVRAEPTCKWILVRVTLYVGVGRRMKRNGGR